MRPHVLLAEFLYDILERIFRCNPDDLLVGFAEPVGKSLHGIEIQLLIGKRESLVAIKLYGIRLNQWSYFRFRVQGKNQPEIF